MDHKAPERKREICCEKKLDVGNNLISDIYFLSVQSTSSFGNPSPTKKLAVQLEQPETAMAAGRGP